MEVYDIVMIVVLVGATLFGAWKGLAWQVASLGAIVLSSVVALKFHEPLAKQLPAQPPWDVPLASLILYVGTSLGIWIAFRFVSTFIDRLKLKEFDRQIGAIFGFVKGGLLCVIITVFAVMLVGDTQRKAIVGSYSGYYVARVLDKAHQYLPDRYHEAVDPYLHSLDERLGTPTHEHAATADPAKAATTVLEKARDFLPAEYQKKVDPYLESLDKQLGTTNPPGTSEPRKRNATVITREQFKQALERAAEAAANPDRR